MEEDLDKYAYLKENINIIYSTQVCGVIRIYDEFKDRNPSEIRRNNLIFKLKIRISRFNLFKVIVFMIPSCLLTISVTFFIAILLNNFIITIQVGIINALLFKLYWLYLTDKFEIDPYYIYNYKQYRKKHGHNKH